MSRRRSDDRPPGLVIVDKPTGLTSHDVVARLRRVVGTRRVGHAGTLDPMATGVLVVGVGSATRLLHHLQLVDKVYTATIRLGLATSSDDADGEPLGGSPAHDLPDAAVLAGIDALRGHLYQVPAAVSAIKVDGRRAHARVRAGERVELAPRPVRVSRFELLAARRDARAGTRDLDVVVECSSGTYVRALARDLGAGLGVGGHLTALRRTRVGPFTLADARTVEQLSAAEDPAPLSLPEAIRRVMPVRQVGAEEARELSYGRALAPAGLPGTYGALSAEGVAIALLSEDGDRARPVLVFTAVG